MKKIKPYIIVIVGPTASGKSELAVRIAKLVGGEIISADSRQVYRGLDIGTGKVKGHWTRITNPAAARLALRRRQGRQESGVKSIFIYKNIPHHCIDFVDPKRQYSVAEFKACAKEAMRDITNRGKMPIIAGGTGFWIDAVVFDINLPEVPPDETLRKKLAKKGARELLAILRKLDHERAKTIEQKNPRRIIRAIEIAKKLGGVPIIKTKSPYRALWIGIKLSPDALKEKITNRLVLRIRQGMLREAHELHKRGLSWKRFYELGLEYRFLADFLRRKITKKEFLTILEHAINEYAKKQMTWFKRNKNIAWADNAHNGEKAIRNFPVQRRRQKSAAKND